MSETSQNNLFNICGAKTKFGKCRNLPMKNGRCRLHGGLTPKKHPNHRAKSNALKTGRYSSRIQKQINIFQKELRQLKDLSSFC